MAELMGFKEFIKRELEAKVADYHNPSCKSCNDCCTITAMITDAEYENIKRYITQNAKGREVYRQGMERIKRYAKYGTMYAMCPFSTPTKRCGIYFIRPHACRTFHCSPELCRFDKEEHHKQCNKSIAHFFFDIGPMTDEEKQRALNQIRAE
jgi:Fe-S-cluster containining protein